MPALQPSSARKRLPVMLWMQMRSGMATSSNCMTTNEPGMPGCEPTRCRAWRIVYGLKSLPFTRLTKVRQSAVRRSTLAQPGSWSPVRPRRPGGSELPGCIGRSRCCLLLDHWALVRSGSPTQYRLPHLPVTADITSDRDASGLAATARRCSKTSSYRRTSAPSSRNSSPSMVST